MKNGNKDSNHRRMKNERGWKTNQQRGIDSTQITANEKGPEKI